VSKNQNREAQRVQEEFISKKSFVSSFSRSQERKEGVGDQNPQGDQAQKR
jgi:hypothetical protein